MPKRPTHNLNMLWIARKQNGLAQKSVARLLGHKTTSVISEYENGRLFPSLRTALKLSIIYQRPLCDLYAPLHQEIKEQLGSVQRSRTIAQPST